MIHRILITESLLSILLSCTSGSTTLKQCEKIAGKKLDDYELICNSACTHILAVQKQGTNTTGIVNFIIFDLSEKSIVTRGTFRPGYIKWMDDNRIEIFDAPGIIKEYADTEQYKKIIYVKAIPR
jgi:hypothetical protein